MLKRSLLFFFIIFTVAVKAQNLVPNPSFEDTIYCPTTPGDIPALTYWYNCGGSPDYYNSCANTSTLVNIPSNWVGYQAAYNGNGYVGLATHCTGCVPNREYIGTQLVSQLIPSTKYYVSIYISRADSLPYTFSSDKFGFRFSTVPFSYTNPPPTDNFSHIHSNAIITDSTGWTKISGSFIADSAYQYVIVGNFYDNANTNTLGSGDAFEAAYYFIDQVCVSTDSLQCNVSVGLVNQNNRIDFSMYPNPATNIVNINFLNNGKPYDIIIYNLFGQAVFTKQKMNFSHSIVDLNDISNGVLLIKILYENQFYYYKLLKQ